ncbi:MAG: alpha-E domain-containing protein [Proteobacteria bacterium]|nr:alpha-E domain-containing protein [Pseudomonadota bacterium]
MLSRGAENLYWMARHVERAENTARALDAAFRMALLESAGADRNSSWASIVEVGPDPDEFKERYGTPTAANVIAYMVTDGENPSSILSSIGAARENARAERARITSELWESLNDTWFAIEGIDEAKLQARGYRSFFEWVKERTQTFNGVMLGTMLRDEGLHFMELGMFLERADNTARLVDVKYHVLLPSIAEVGGAADYYQWASLLRSLGALRAYRRIYKGTIVPWQVAEMLILRGDVPRALHHCYEVVADILDRLGGQGRLPCQQLAHEIYAGLRFGRIEEITRNGLHEFLEEFILENNTLGRQVQRDFLMADVID